MPKELMAKVRKTPDDKMLKILDLMAVRMRYMKDIKNHMYFWECPDYQTDLGKNFLSKLKQSELTNKKILSDLAEAIEKVPSRDFDAGALNKICSVYLYEQNTKHGLILKNEDVFFLFRYAMTGNPVGAPIGDISEVIGKDQVL
jgi:hypothetical protein